MENLFYNISQVLGITVIHSLWQGLIIYMVLRVFVQVLPGLPAIIKYRVAFAALAGVLGWFAYTLFLQLISYEWQSVRPVSPIPLSLPGPMRPFSEPANRYYVVIAGYMPYVTIVYVIGLVFNTLRLTFAWNNIYRIRQYAGQSEFADSISRLSKKLNLKKSVRAVFSEWVDVPCVTGFIKPIILLPVSLSCYLNTDEVEAILLHELAHVKRNDYLYNFLQQVIGIILFFNPFARFIGKIINEERENCCDDLVVQTTRTPFIYAQTLLKLEENKQYQWQLALAATGKQKFELLNRIERIMKTKKHTINIRPVLITVLALACSVTSIAWLNPKIEDGQLKVKNLKPALDMLSSVASGDIASAQRKASASTAKKPFKAKKHQLLVSYDDTTFNNLSDTTKKTGKYKRIIIVDENGVQKQYTSANDLPADIKQELNAENFYKNFNFSDTSFTKMNRYFESAAWKKQQAAIEARAADIAKRFESKEWKNQQKAIEKQALAMNKRFESKEWKKRQEAIEKQAEDIAKKYDSPEWKSRQEDFIKATTDLAMRALELGSNTPNSAEWKKQQKELQALGLKTAEATKKMVISSEARKLQKQLDEQVLEFNKKLKDLPKLQKIKGLKELPELPEIKEVPEVKEMPEAKDIPVAPVKPVAPIKPL